MVLLFFVILVLCVVVCARELSGGWFFCDVVTSGGWSDRDLN